MEGAVKQPEKACSMETKEATIRGSDMVAPAMSLCGNDVIAENDQDGYPSRVHRLAMLREGCVA